jgi:hypothetical protein
LSRRAYRLGYACQRERGHDRALRRVRTPEGAANSCYVHFLFDLIRKHDGAAGADLTVQRHR